MDRIVLTGDTHGVLETGKILEYQRSEKKLNRDDYLIICGDCGVVWDKETLDDSIDLYQSFGTNILFVDGNHENFDLLNFYPVIEWNGGLVHKIADGIYHLMRGQVFEICGKKILTLGGANSIDVDFRQEHTYWWKDEEFSENNIKIALKNLKKHKNIVDFVISHSPTDEIIDLIKKFYGENNKAIPYYLKNKLERTKTSENLQTIASKIKFKEWICGHLHLDKKGQKYRVIYNKFYEIH